MTDSTRAALWMSGAIASFTVMAVAGRAVSVELDTFEIMLYRSITGLLVVLALSRLFGTLNQINARQLGLHGARNLAHFAGQNLWFYALPLIPLAQVFALEFTTPVWVILLSSIILKERITRTGALATLLGFIGVLIVTRPFAAPPSPGLISAASAAIGFALTAVFTRKLTHSQTTTCILFWLTLMQAAFGMIRAGFDGNIAIPSAQTLPFVIAIGLAGLFAHYCLTTALSLAPASFVMPIDFIRLPLIAILAALLYGEKIDIWVFAGAALIFGASYVNILYRQQKAADM